MQWQIFSCAASKLTAMQSSNPTLGEVPVIFHTYHIRVNVFDVMVQWITGIMNHDS